MDKKQLTFEESNKLAKVKFETIRQFDKMLHQATITNDDKKNLLLNLFIRNLKMNDIRLIFDNKQLKKV